MVNPYDKAYELAEALRKSDAFVRLQELKQQIGEDDSVLRMLQDYRKRQWELQQQQMMGQEISEADASGFQKLTEVVNLNVQVRSYLEAERQLSVLFWDIQGILAKTMDEAGLESPMAE